MPALAIIAEPVGDGDTDIVEEDLGEDQLAVHPRDRRRVTPGASSGNRIRLMPLWRSLPGSRNSPKAQSANTARVDQIFWPLRT